MSNSETISNAVEAFTSVPRGRHVSVLRKLLNVTGCLFIIPAFYLATVQSLYPMTMDMLINIILTECNRFTNEGRRISFYSAQNGSLRRDDGPGRGKDDLEMQKPASKLGCIAAIVGHREDPELFTRALESYKAARGYAFMIVGIDGDDAEDQDMTDVFNKVGLNRGNSPHGSAMLMK